MGQTTQSKAAASKRRNATAQLPPRVGLPRVWIFAVLTAVAVTCVVVWAIGRNHWPDESLVPVYSYEVVNTYPHDKNAYCQGLVLVDGELYEGTGKYGSSTLRRVELETGRILQQVDLEEQYFGEGITAWQNQIIQLTWQEQVGLVYDRATLTEIGRFNVEGEGWGLTHDGRHLVISDGSSTLRFLDPVSYQVVRRVTVRNGGSPVRRLNELEYVNGEIWANVWHKDYIVRISPADGAVTGRINLRGLLPASQRPHPEAVLNGIAYDAKKDRLFVTGKNWPWVFEIRVRPQ